MIESVLNLPNDADFFTDNASEFSARAKALAGIHADTDSRHFACNLSTRVELVDGGSIALPITINDGEPGNAWVCSPRTTYADYAAEEMVRAGPGFCAAPSRMLGRAIGRWLDRVQIDRAVVVNNWLVTTNLYPPLHAVALPRVLAEIRERWPRHAIWFRSLNFAVNAEWLAALSDLGFTLLPSRQVYLYTDVAALAKRHINLRRDLKLLRTTQTQRAGIIRDDDYARIAELYAMLYMRKYSRCNPDYTQEFMRTWHRAGLLEFDGLRDADGTLQCIAGMFRQGRTLTVPIVGYDTDRPQSMALYRLACACVCDAAIRGGFDINFSAGAAQFKRLRGGVATIEYSAVDVRHMPRATRRAVSVLSNVTRRIGVPIMQRFQR